ncbi:hypothetical protein ACFSKS_14700 [Pseudocitrobacter faecalis]
MVNGKIPGKTTMKKMIIMGLLAGMAYMTSFTATGKELTSLLAPTMNGISTFLPKGITSQSNLC